MLEWTSELHGGGRARVRFSERREGDFRGGFQGGFAGEAPQRQDNRDRIAAGPWTRLRQQHGAAVVEVEAPGDGDGALADAAVTSAAGAVLTVRVADCAPVALVAREGAVAAVHAGWRGLAAGVIEAAAAAVRRLGGEDLRAYLGPCIGPECYEFAAEPLAVLADRLGPAVIGRTAWGTPALDIPAAVRCALGLCGVERIVEAGQCTACDAARWYSHRARGDAERHVLATWIG
ncbi:MAG: polyphenol oxidase family protein [bacterium]|nr:polyphenol oxidase family protein [bacterium]